MNDDEIRAEIERRRKRAVDLKLLETLWSLYSSEFKYLDDYLAKEPDSVLPEIRSSIQRSTNISEFTFMNESFGLECVEGPVDREGRGFDETRTTPLKLSLTIGCKCVFEFEMKQRVTYTPDMPLFHESMGRVTAFIEGPWVEQISELLRQMKNYRREYLKRKNAPKEAQKLKSDMSRFGL